MRFFKRSTWFDDFVKETVYNIVNNRDPETDIFKMPKPAKIDGSAMITLAVSVEEEQKEWLREKAKSENTSMSKIVRDCIQEMKNRDV